MNYKTLKITLICCALLCLITEARAMLFQHKGNDQSAATELVSYAYTDFSTSPQTSHLPTGSTTITALTASPQSGASFKAQSKGWLLTSSSNGGIDFSLSLSTAGMVQVAAQVYPYQNGAVLGNVGDEYAELTITAGDFTQTKSISVFDQKYVDNIVVFEVPQSVLSYKSANAISLSVASNSPNELLVRNVMFLPQKIVVSSDKLLRTTLYTQFGETNINGYKNLNDGNIWTRAYGLDSLVEMLPAPTFYFNPGDLLSVNLINKLNPKNNSLLAEYEEIQGASFSPDETLVKDELRGEINIPHNLNNTNLHVHGLHVDPSKDDVTIVIVPEDADSTGYDAPAHAMHGPTKDLDSLNAFSVSDQSVKGGKWDYQYKIPTDHLPGTHWYHPHKHGSTAAQLENGLAGTIVIMENEETALVPYPNTANSTIGKSSQTQTPYDLEKWQAYHDRVFAMQEITNFGLQTGKGKGKGNRFNAIATSNGQSTDTIQVTVNGQLADTIVVRPGQLERWRMVNAGTNHRAFSQMWLGKYVGTHNYQSGGKSVTTAVYQSTPMYLAAVDGITMAELDTVTAENPALLAPGNRSDFLVQLADTGRYTLFKDYNLKGYPMAILSTDGQDTLYNNVTKPAFWPETAPTKENPYLFEQTGTDPSNFLGFTQPWNASQNGTGSVSIVPLIKSKTIKGGRFLDVDFATKSEFGVGERGKWQPYNFGAGLNDADLFTVHVKGTKVASDSTPNFPNPTYLAKVAPVKMTNPPSYVSPIDDPDVLQSRPVVFDVSGLQINVDSDKQGYNGNIKQFTLNGRFFELDDMIGNEKADSIIKSPFQRPTEIESSRDQKAGAISQNLTFTDFFFNNSTNKTGSGYFFTNPGYYQSISSSTVDGIVSYGFSGTGTPTWSQLTGISDSTLSDGSTKPRPAIVNTQATNYERNKNVVGNLPLAQNAEEWILINNSDVSHPFHIHINPFFVVEVGQITYRPYVNAQKSTSNDWFMQAVTAPGYPQRPDLPTDGTATPGMIYKGEIGVDAIVGNWWDTITVPAHGYVKVRYWFNVPYQTGEGKEATVVDDYNREGIWVYHCHILRHEDRGMMMPVITKPQNLLQLNKKKRKRRSK